MKAKLIAGYLKCWRIAMYWAKQGGVLEVDELFKAKDKIWAEMNDNERNFALLLREAGSCEL